MLKDEASLWDFYKAGQNRVFIYFRETGQLRQEEIMDSFE